MSEFVIVGASLAGLRAAEAARRLGFAGRITLVGAEPHLPYDRPPLSKTFLDVLDDGSAPASPTYHDDSHFAETLDVTLELGVAATGLDTVQQRVLLDNREIRYDQLVIATGAHPRTVPAWERLKGVFCLRTIDDARAIRAALDAGARTVVVGAGFIGSEIAASARKRNLDVTIVEAAPAPLVHAIGETMGPLIAALHERHGTTLRCGVTVESLVGDHSVEAVVLSDGTTLPADLVVVGIGAAPTVGWLAASSLTLNDGVVCDETLWAGAPGVYAAGDVARWPNPRFGRLQRLEHWTSASEQGAAAARNALDPEHATPYTAVPYFWSDWYGSRIQFVGIPHAQEVTVVEGDPTGDGRWVALYRDGDCLVGALAVNGQPVIMKYNQLIARSASWGEALDLAAERRAAVRASG